MALSKQQKISLAAAFLCGTAFLGVKTWLAQYWQPQEQAQTAACDAAQGCVFDGAHFRLEGMVTNQSVFAAEVRGLPENVEKVEASFSMKDMDMGFNRFALQRQADGSWRLDNIRLPVCVSNRHDWLVQWRVDGKSYAAPFHTAE